MRTLRARRARLTRGVEYRPEELQLSVRVSYDHPRCDGVVSGGNVRLANPPSIPSGRIGLGSGGLLAALAWRGEPGPSLVT
jgi:hypothetical protein